MNWLKAGERANSTIALRARHVHRYLEEVAATSGVLDPLSLPVLANHLANPDWAPATRRSVRSSLHLWTSWLHLTGQIPLDPIALLPKMIQPRSVPRPCPDAVIRKALSSADRRSAAMLLLAADTGLRRAELARVSRDDLMPDLFSISLLIHGKGRRERVVPLSAAALSAVERQFQTVPADIPWLFPSTGRYSTQHIGPIRVGELLAEALPGSWTGHSLRHRFATRAYQRSRDLILVQGLMGHSKPETTAAYISLDTTDARDLVRQISLDADPAPR